MNVGELIKQIRNINKDRVEGNYLAFDEELIEYLNEAQSIAARNNHLLKSSDLSLGETLASATITVSGDFGNLTQIIIDGVNIIENSVAYVANNNASAALVSNEINSVGLFVATPLNNTIKLTPNGGFGSHYNNIAPVCISTNPSITSNAFAGGIDGPCRIQLKNGVKEYKFDSRITKIERFTLGSTQCPLCVSDYRNMNAGDRNYYNQKGEPHLVMYGQSNDGFTLGKIPAKKDFLQLVITYDPLKKLTKNSDVPEIPSRFHHSLINWALYKYYSKSDSEIDAMELSNVYLARFEKEFGDNAYSAAGNFNLYFFFSDENEYR